MKITDFPDGFTEDFLNSVVSTHGDIQLLLRLLAK